MNIYHIRFNTKHNNSELVWRIFENSNEYLVKGFKISVPMFDETTIEDGITKWNVCCYVDDVAIIE
jgi:hypothetical protein